MYVNLIEKSLVLIEVMDLLVIPREGELIYLNKQGKYVKVVNVVHHTYSKRFLFITKQKQGVNLIVEEFNNI